MLDPRFSYVVAVARAGSFTAAAEMAGVTQSAVTKSVADLERQIGYSLFHRTARGALLTEQGRDFVERAARLTEDAGELLRRPKGLKDAYAGTLRIGVCPASLEWQLAAPLELVLTRYPSIRVDVNGASFERMVPQLRNGAVDVAMGYDAAFGVWSDLRRYPLASDRTTLFVRRGHPLLERPAIGIADLAEFEFVSPSDSRPYGTVIHSIYENQGVDWQRRVHIVDYFPIVRRIVSTTDAIGVVAEAHGHSASFQARFATLDAIELFAETPRCCAIRAAWEPKPAVRAFISACIDHDAAMTTGNAASVE